MVLTVRPLRPGRGRGAVLKLVDLVGRTGATGGAVVALSDKEWEVEPTQRGGVVGYLVAGWPRAEKVASRLPAVGEFDADLVVDGEVVTVDGTGGTVTIDGVVEREVVTAFVQRPDGRILLLRRSEAVGSFRGRWSAVSGFLEDPTPLDQARREIVEETGLRAARLVRAGGVFYARSDAVVYAVHPFLFRVEEPAVQLDWESAEAEWVDPAEISGRPTVPKLDRAWTLVCGSPSEGKANSLTRK